ncbi:MAG: hypothetical protein FWD69_04920 [Polyangiaceae bacterium]|nr:hypothetical protein [Polyangiaceae bacterium]
MASSPSSLLRGHVITALTVLVSGAATAGSAALAVGSCAERDRLHHAQSARSLEITETVAANYAGASPSEGAAKPPTNPGAIGITNLTSAELPQEPMNNAPPAAEPAPVTDDQAAVPEGRDLASVLEDANAQMARMPPVAGHASHANNDANNRPEAQEGLAAEIAKALTQIEDEREARRQEEHAAEEPPQPSPAQASPDGGQSQPESAGGPTREEPTREEEQRASATLTPEPPSFSSGAGQFTTEAPFWSASSMGPPDPSMGAGHFTTERTLPPGVVFYGVSGAGTQADLSTVEAARTTSPNVTTTGVTPPPATAPPGIAPPAITTPPPAPAFSPLPMASPFGGTPLTTRR